MNSKQVYCKNCNLLVPAKDINIETMAAKCTNCDHIFGISLPDASSKFTEKFDGDEFGKSDPARPKKITMEAVFGGGVHLKKLWFTPALFAMLIFCVVWDSFIVFWYSTALTQPDAPWIMVVFPLGHVAVGVGLTYTVIAGFLNKTHIVADQFLVSVKHGPIPWMGNKELNAKDIELLMVQEDASKSQRHPTYRNFKIMANVNGEETKLVGGLEQSEARYIAYQVSKQIKVELVFESEDRGDFFSCMPG